MILLLFLLVFVAIGLVLPLWVGLILLGKKFPHE